MGGIQCPHGDHIRKWDLISRTVNDDEEWVLVSRCYHCDDPPYWEVYLNEDPLPSEPIRIEPYENS